MRERGELRGYPRGDLGQDLGSRGQKWTGLIKCSLSVCLLRIYKRPLLKDMNSKVEKALLPLPRWCCFSPFLSVSRNPWLSTRPCNKLHFEFVRSWISKSPAKVKPNRDWLEQKKPTVISFGGIFFSRSPVSSFQHASSGIVKNRRSWNTCFSSKWIENLQNHVSCMDVRDRKQRGNRRRKSSVSNAEISVMLLRVLMLLIFFVPPFFPVLRDRFARFPERFPDGLGEKVASPRLLSTLSFVSERMGTNKRGNRMIKIWDGSGVDTMFFCVVRHLNSSKSIGIFVHVASQNIMPY